MMSRHNFWTPLSVLIAGLVVIVVLLAGPHTRSVAGPQLQEDYPPPTATAKAALTQTAAAAETATWRAKYPGPVNNTATATKSPVGSTATPTRTDESATDEGATAQASASATESDTPPDQAEPPIDTPEASATPTFTPTPANDLECSPGQPITISGEGPPRAPFLLYFDQRAVSGGSVEPDGRFTITLVVGSERAGAYEVTVRVRGGTQVLRRLTCSVPPTTPTPLPTVPLSSMQ